ncbi:MAG: FAD-dependent oxidoreductase, partial [Planctomycetota bacterium]
MTKKYDVVVIGSGPGGEGAAMQLAKGGKQVAIVEKYGQMGGGCTHWGTIPSKALRFAIHQYIESVRNPLVHVETAPSLSELRQSARSIIEKQESMRRGFYMRNNVDVIHGTAIFDNSNQVSINDGETKLEADHFVIAVGSRPYRPATVDFDHPRIFDSDSILGLDHRPNTMTVYGAGVIGCEYTSMFRSLKIKINLVNSRSRLLDFLDDEVSDALSYQMRDRGIAIRHDEHFKTIEGTGDGVILTLES